ncbi:hypothetical protein GGR53DRAFT_245291 [Hypoxylon sp. FL1150]|nr:hypothetical protein GGR53DRAFT_245291 [Hypoxylon sp. FL1150]
MAPTSKPTVPGSSSSSSKPTATATGNPAPDFTVNMNRIQMQLEARLKAARAFLPSRSNNTASGGGSFSALHTSAPQTRTQLQSREDSARAAAARRQAEEAEFAEDRGLDPNAGIGLVRAPAGGNESGRDRDTARLRGRLLGKRGRAGGVDGDGRYKWQRKEDSSDEEAGRGGLGRARNGKRSRAELEENGGRENGDAAEAYITPATREAENLGDATVGGKDTVESSTAKSAEEGESNPPDTEGNSKKKRKKKKNKSKDKTED